MQRASYIRDSATTARSGVLLVVALCAIGIISVVMISIVQATVMQRQLLQSEGLRLQADWLLHSAVQRASAQLNAKSDYTGEVWEVSADDWQQTHAARVEIKLLSKEDTRPRQVSVRVESPPGETAVVRLSRSIDL